MELGNLYLDRYLYKDSKQSSETPSAPFLSADSSEPADPGIPAGGAAQDINTGNVQLDGGQIIPGTVPQTVLDVSNYGWGQTCAFSSTDLNTVSWGAGVFTSADGTAYNISAGNTGDMAAKTYIYLDLNVSETVYQITTTSATSVGLGKVLIAVAENGAVSATYNLSEATQIVGDNILANTIDAAKIKAGTVAVDVYLSVGSGNNIFKADTNGIYLGNATFASAPFSVNMTGDIIASSLRRKDFHWMTLFESVDGYDKSVAPASIVAGANGLVIQTSNTANTVCDINKSVYNDSSSQFTWGKKRSLKILLITGSDITANFLSLSTGGQRYDGENTIGLGFYAVNGDIEGRVSSGTDYSFTSTTSLRANTAYRLEIVYEPGVNAKFYVNGTLLGTLTTNLPSTSSTSLAGYVLTIYFENNEAANKQITLSYWDFWQGN